MPGRRKPAKPKAPRPLHHRVYVVELKDYDGPGTVAYYVGMTGLPLAERFRRHKEGTQSARVVKRYGARLAPEFYEHLPAMTFEDAQAMETRLAEIMRAEGYVVFGGH